MRHLEIFKLGQKYIATIGHRLPNTTQVHTVFKSALALSEFELTDVLLALGFHQREIRNAFNVANGKSAHIPHAGFRRAF